MFKKFFIILIFVLAISTFYHLFKNYSFHSIAGEIKTITLTFDAEPTTYDVDIAPLKYDKDFALSWTFDDGYGTIYRNVFPFMNGGYILIDDTSYPGLYFTDGAGNDIPFTAGEAWFTRQAPELNEMHASDDTYFWMANDEMIEMIDHGWGIVHHGLTSAAFRDSRIANGDPLIQYPTPPGPDYLNYAYEVSQGAIEIENDLGVTPTTFIAPSGDHEYRIEAYNQGYKFISARSGSYQFGEETYTVLEEPLQVDNINTDNLVMGYRRSLSDSAFTPANMLDMTTTTAALLNDNTHLWISESTHQVPETPIGGSILYSTMKSYLQTIESTYGKSGLDNMWFAGVPEVYEYVKTKNDVILSTEQNGTEVTITLDTSAISSDQMYYALSLNVTSDQDLIDIEYETGEFEHYSHNLSTGLINVDWSPRWETLAEKYVSIVEQSLLQIDLDTAQSFVNKISDGSIRAPYQTRLDNLEINTARTYLIDIGNDIISYHTLGNWNNIFETQLTETDLVDVNGQVGNIDLEAIDYYDTDSGVSEEYCTLYPYTAMRDSFRVNTANPLSLHLTELDNSKVYTFKIYAGRQYGNSSITDFTVGEETVSLQALNNFTNQTVQIEDISPTSNELTLTVSSPIDDRGFINVLELIESDPIPPSCDDHIRNQDETDIDCGGSICGACGNGRSCTVTSDCSGNRCEDGICMSEDDTCYDGILNQDETDIDCGGSICGSCINTMTCYDNSDCTSNYCNNYACESPTGDESNWYFDFGNDGYWEETSTGWNNLTDETFAISNLENSDGESTDASISVINYHDLDGGYDDNGVGYPLKASHDGYGIDSIAGPLLLNFSNLSSSNTYNLSFFAAKHGGGSAITRFTADGKTDTVQAQGNTDQLVTLEDITTSNGDLTVTAEAEEGENWGFICAMHLQQEAYVPTCSDGIKNQDESDIDCGGNSCDPCNTQDTCNTYYDCNNLNTCIDNLCELLPTCSDDIKNQDETDIDCGGNTCGNCSTNESCLQNSDCSSTSFCNENFACEVSPTCSDGIKNQDETDIDCGGSTCEACPSKITVVVIQEPQEQQTETNTEDENQSPILQTVKVTILDKERNPIPNIKVTLYSTPKVEYTNIEGVATFKDVEPGFHRIEIEDKNTKGLLASRELTVSNSNSNDITDITIFDISVSALSTENRSDQESNNVEEEITDNSEGKKVLFNSWIYLGLTGVTTLILLIVLFNKRSSKTSQ